MMRAGTIVDCRPQLDQEPGRGKRAPEMHQTKKGNEWHFGMNMHIGLDLRDDLIHGMETTAANVHDLSAADDFLHVEERRGWDLCRLCRYP